MSLPQSVADVLKEHLTLEYEALDRMYLNAYVPKLQTEGGVAAFFRHHRGHPFASSALMAPMTLSFVRSIERFVQLQRVPLILFAKGQRKDDVMKEHLGRFDRDEGVLFVGKAQEKARVFRTERRTHPDTGAPYPWTVRASARIYCRILRPGMSQLAPGPKFWRRSRQPTWGRAPALPPTIRAPLRKLEQALDQWRHRAKLAA